LLGQDAVDENRMGLKLPMIHRGIQLDARVFGRRFIRRAVMLSEAKQLWLFSLVDRSRFDPRFFASLRMT
jgi:hypothetical protein